MARRGTRGGGQEGEGEGLGGEHHLGGLPLRGVWLATLPPHHGGYDVPLARDDLGETGADRRDHVSLVTADAPRRGAGGGGPILHSATPGRTAARLRGAGHELDHVLAYPWSLLEAAAELVREGVAFLRGAAVGRGPIPAAPASRRRPVLHQLGRVHDDGPVRSQLDLGIAIEVEPWLHRRRGAAAAADEEGEDGADEEGGAKGAGADPAVQGRAARCRGGPARYHCGRGDCRVGGPVEARTCSAGRRALGSLHQHHLRMVLVVILLHVRRAGDGRGAEGPRPHPLGDEAKDVAGPGMDGLRGRVLGEVELKGAVHVGARRHKVRVRPGILAFCSNEWVRGVRGEGKDSTKGQGREAGQDPKAEFTRQRWALENY